MPDLNVCKPLIGILASHDSYSRNEALSSVLDFLVEEKPDMMRRFQFAMTKGTYNRVLFGRASTRTPAKPKSWIECRGVNKNTRKFLLEESKVFRLPGRRRGGVVLMAHLVVKRQLSTIWPFLTPTTAHWLALENLALLRLSDHCRVNRLMNVPSVIEWMSKELSPAQLYTMLQCPPVFKVGGLSPESDLDVPIVVDGAEGAYKIDWEAVRRMRSKEPRPTLALIAHDEMKSRIEDFVIDYQNQLDRFERIIATGTTGKVVADAAPALARKVRRYNSGPKGGDIEIATEMMFKRCDVAVFLVDPLSPHPHSEDIRVLFGAAVLNGVRLLTNERQARLWMDRTGGVVERDTAYDAWCHRNNRPNWAT